MEGEILPLPQDVRKKEPHGWPTDEDAPAKRSRTSANKIGGRVNKLQRRNRIVMRLKEVDLELGLEDTHSDILIHNYVRWLINSRVLERECDLNKKIVAFLVSLKKTQKV